MADDSKTPESGAGKAPPPKIKAEDNPWYLLATLYGVPKDGDDEPLAINRIAWNRYFAADLDEQTRTKLIEDKRYPAEELTRFSPEELQEVKRAFTERCKGSGKKFAFPDGSADINFSNVEFEQEALFEGYLFSRSCFFWHAAFSRWATFAGATFSGRASFADAAFSRWATFAGATFSGRAYFDGAIFSGQAYFGHVTFGETSAFVNAEMKEETSFEGTILKTEPPRFFGAKLHQGTVWRGIKWPRPKNKNMAGAFMDAYACLRLEMDRLNKHDDELDFFALEMASRRMLQGPVRGLPLLLYGLLSGYSRSYLRPLVALCMVAAIGAGAFSYFDARTSWEALGLSAANTLNVFGLRRDFNLSIDTPLDWLKVFAALQTILGAILLFLFGLGVRNKFRMK